MSQSVLILCFISALVTLIALFIGRFPKLWRLGLFAFVVAIFIAAYLYTPLFDNDLTHYFSDLSAIKGTSLSSANQYFTDNYKDNLYFRNLVFWLISNFASVHFLPAISTSCVFGIAGYLIGDYAQKINKENYIGPLIFIVFLQLPLFGIIVNVRNIWAFSIVILAAYRDLICKKRNLITLLLYVLPCMLHSAAVILILLRIIVPLTKKIKVLSPIIVVLIPGIVTFVYNHLGQIPVTFQSSVTRIYGYMTNDLSTQWSAEVASSTFFSVQKISMITVSVLLILLIYFLNDYFEDGESSYIYYNMLILLMVIACNIFSVPHYWRFYCASIICSNLIVITALDHWKGLKVTPKLIFILYLISGPFMYILNFISTHSSY